MTAAGHDTAGISCTCTQVSENGNPQSALWLLYALVSPALIGSGCSPSPLHTVISRTENFKISGISIFFFSFYFEHMHHKHTLLNLELSAREAATAEPGAHTHMERRCRCFRLVSQEHNTAKSLPHEQKMVKGSRHRWSSNMTVIHPLGQCWESSAMPGEFLPQPHAAFAMLSQNSKVNRAHLTSLVPPGGRLLPRKVC